METKKYCVYKHTSPSGKVYIGITRQKPERRFENGNGYAKSPVFYNAIKKYSWENFSTEILDDNLLQEEAEALEIWYIAFFGSSNRDNGYNLTTGGGAHGTHSQESIKKMSKAAMGNKKFLGHRHSDKTKEKISVSAIGNQKGLGHHPSKEAREKMGLARAKRVVQYNRNGQKIAEYPSTEKAGVSVGGDGRNIATCCRGIRKAAYGFVWRYVDQQEGVSA